MVFAELLPGKTLEITGLQQFLSDRMPGFMIPSFMEVVDELPRTQTGKVLKGELRQRVRDREGINTRLINTDAVDIREDSGQMDTKPATVPD